MKRLLFLAILFLSAKSWASLWFDTIYITAPSGQTLICERYTGPTTIRYTLYGDTATLSGDLIVPHTIIWPYTDGEGITHYPTYTVNEFNFHNCRHLTSVQVQEGFLYVGSFSGCTSITSVQLPSNINSIPPGAFDGCASLQNINIPNGVTEIGSFAFRKCSSLQHIILPNSVSVLGSAVFDSCVSLNSITIPPMVRNIENGTFRNCHALTTVSLPDSLLSIGSYEFYYGSEAPMYHTRAAGAFEQCLSLSSIVIPRFVSLIGNYAFLGCTNLTEIVFPDTICRLCPLAFSRCGIVQLNLPNNIEELGYGVFSKCTSLQEVTIPRNMWHIGHYTFDSCVNLTTVNFNADSCWWGAEGYCWSSGSANPCLESRLWLNCPNFTTLNIGDNVKLLTAGLFSGASGITEVTIPPSVKRMGNGVFSGCASLTVVNYNADTMEYYGDSFGGCPNLTSLSIGNNVKNIPACFMRDVSSLRNTVIIPDSVVSIGSGAFEGCTFDTIIIGSSVTSIGQKALYNNSLRGVFLRTQLPPSFITSYWSRSFHYNTLSQGILHIPCGTREIYQQSIWYDELDDGYGFVYIEDPRMEIVANSNGHGIVELSDSSLCEDSTAVLQAIADSGYVFSNWSDGDTTNPRTIVLMHDTSLMAYFTVVPTDCDNVTLPYAADFTQCWTADGGASIINSGQIKFGGHGQKATSPWFTIPDSAGLHLKWVASKDSINGTILESAPIFIRKIRVLADSSERTTQTNSWWNNTISMSEALGTQYAGQTIQIEFEYTGTDSIPFSLNDVTLFQFADTVEVSAPTHAYVGDTIVLASHVSLPEGDFGPYVPYWNFYTSNWTSVSANSIGVDNNQADSVVAVFDTPGEYIATFTYTIWNVFNGYPVYSNSREVHISIIDTATVDCDSIALPYIADFTQCWTAEGGATIIDPTHAAITSAGQKVTSPWMESESGKSFLRFAFSCDNNHDWNPNQTVRITIENNNGIIVSWEDITIGNGSSLYYFVNPGGPIRASFEYTGTQPCSDFVFSGILLYSYQIEVNLEGPNVAQVGDTLTFTSHATLQNGDMVDYYEWYMNNPDGSWMDDHDPARTIISRTDSTLMVVFSNPGRYYIYSEVAKNDVYQGNSAYAMDAMYLNIIDYSIYQEDSIYYTSEAKDTIIGCHPQLHAANLPESVRVIADSAFFNLTNLTSVTLPDGLSHIGKMAFAWNQGITEITLPRNLQFVGDNAFEWDTNLATVNFNATHCTTMCTGYRDNGYYYPAFVGCNNLSTINIGENVTRIPDFAFSDCNGLRGTLTIPDAVTHIGRNAFSQWGATDVYHLVLGSGLTEIGLGAFAGSQGHIGSITLRNAVPPTIADGYAFSDYSPVLSVPCGSVDAYRAAPGWANFSIIRDNCGGESDMPVLNVNNINTTVYPLGYLGYDGNQTNYFVNGTRLSTLCANGLWIGSGEHTAIRQFGTSGDDFQVGPLTNDGQPLGDNSYNRVWAVSRDMIDYHLAHFAEPGYEPAESISSWPAEDDNVGHAMAPYYDANHDGHYNPLDGDYPLIRGDRALFSIFNDAGAHGESGGQALGVEVHCMTYAFREPQDDALWNTVFVHYDIYNRSSNTYEDTYVGMWSDFDIGYAYDDYVGCDVALGMYYAYNGQESDVPGPASFYGVPPAQGCVILAGPWQSADGLDNASADSETWHFIPGDTLNNQAINGMGFGNGIADDERIGMTNFTYYQNSTNAINGAPTEAIHYYNYLHSFWKNGQHVKYGGDGLSVNAGATDIDCSFMFPGNSDPWHWGTDGIDPDTPHGWDEVTANNAPSDRRGLGSCGPFTLLPSAMATACQQLDVAYVTGWGQASVGQSVENLQTNAASIRQQFASSTTFSGRPFVYQPIVTGIDTTADKSTLQAYPNPTSGTLTVRLSDGEPCDVELYDMMGRKILSQRIKGSATIDLHNLPQGVYLLRTSDGAKRIVKR